jgi:transposase
MQVEHSAMPTAEERIAALEAEVAALRAQVQEVLTQNQKLRARLANATKDRHTSSTLPASDPLGHKRPRSQRRRSGKQPGGQLGHRGETLHLVAIPDEVVEHRPAVCRACQAPLDETASGAGDERRLVQELPSVRRRVCEHRALHVRCPACAIRSPGARWRSLCGSSSSSPIPSARVRELVADLFGVRVSLGTLTRWVAPGAETLRSVEEAIQAALQRAPVLHSDATGVRRAGKLAWAHVASTARLTPYAIHAKRGHEATDAIGILPVYRGVSVHDGWKPSRHSTACRHALCTIHPSRAS